MTDGTETLVVGGSLAVRLIAAPDEVREQVERELGGRRGNAAGLPVLTVRFVDRIDRRASLTLLGLTGGGFAYDDGRFFVLGSRHRLVAIDLDGPAGDLEIVAERGVGRVPMLASLTGLLLVEQGLVMLHASAFVHHERGVLVAGWQSGGKSELLLGFMAGGGARYVADEWTVVGFANGSMRGMTGHPHIWAWQLEQLPAFRERVPAAERRRLAMLDVARTVVHIVPRRGRRRVVAGLLDTFDGWLANASRVTVPAGRMFGTAVEPGPVPIDHLLLPTVTADGSLRIASVAGSEVAVRMTASLEYERRELDAAHAQFRYAFPDRRWSRLDNAAAMERRILVAALGSVPAHLVAHPYPPDLESLAGAVQRVLG